MREINCVVTDLDDTIWDWLTMWHNSFEPYLSRISNEFNIDKKTLKADFKKIHRRYGTSESSFVYEELTVLNDEQKEKIGIKPENSKSILHEYYSNKKNELKLLKGVLEFLNFLKEKGTLVVGFTESNVFFTKYRLKHLELDGLFNCIYAPVDTGVPESVYRHYPEEHWNPKITKIRHLSASTRKPDSEMLEIILKDFGVEKSGAIYIGDKLDRDVYMAKEAGLIDIYANYGHSIETQQYQLLKDVTHWTDEDVQKEIDFKKSFNINTNPTITLSNSLIELKSAFKFISYDEKR